MDSDIEPKIRHLEMIQGVITRMASNSFMLKGWTVVIIAGVFMLATRDSDMFFLLVAYIPIIMFWALDSYYLQLERKFRILYNNRGKCDELDLTFKVAPSQSSRGDKTLYIQCLFSISEIWFYLPLAILVIIIFVYRIAIACQCI